MIENSDGNNVTYIDGNGSNNVAVRTKSVSYFYGYITPNYPSAPAPTRATLTIDQADVLAGETFTLRCAADQPCDYFWVSIFRSSTGEKVAEGGVDSGGVFQTSFLSCDQYSAYATAANSSGAVDSNWIDFWVYGTNPPTEATCTPSKALIKLGDSITLKSWMNAYYARYFFSIYHEQSDKLVDDGWKPESYTFTPSKAGKYNVNMSAYTKAGTAHAGWSNFYVFTGQENLGSDFYAYISHSATGKRIEANGGNVQLAQYGNDDRDWKQIWHFQRQTDGSYIIENADGDGALDVLNGGAENGTNVQVYKRWGADNAAQRWFIENTFSSGNSYTFISKCGYRVLDLLNGSTDPGTNAQLHVYNRSEAQRFTIQKLSNLPQPFSITTQPQNTTVTAGDTATIPVEATGENLTYQWYTKNANQSRFYKSSVTTDTYSVTATEKMSGRQLYCVIKDANGETLTTDTVTLTVEKPSVPLAIVTQPQSVTVAPGEVAAISVTAAGEGLSYQWYTKNANQSRFYKSSVTSDTYSVTTTEKMSGRQLYCVVKDANGNTITTDTVTLTVEKPAAPLAIVTQPQNVTVVPGETVIVTVEAAGEGLTYQWYTKNANQSRFYKSSVTSDTYSVTATAKMSGRQLYCVVKDASGTTLTTDTVTLTVG